MKKVRDTFLLIKALFIALTISLIISFPWFFVLVIVVYVILSEED
jgi:hypothetical protein